jgi:hypothetical protein
MDVQERTAWREAGEEELAGVVELRRAIHADPELGLDCARTGPNRDSISSAGSFLRIATRPTGPRPPRRSASRFRPGSRIASVGDL